jgi:hypothetical protein
MSQEGFPHKLGKDDGFVFKRKDLPLDVPEDGPGEDNFF